MRGIVTFICFSLICYSFLLGQEVKIQEVPINPEYIKYIALKKEKQKSLKKGEQQNESIPFPVILDFSGLNKRKLNKAKFYDIYDMVSYRNNDDRDIYDQMNWLMCEQYAEKSTMEEVGSNTIDVAGSAGKNLLKSDSNLKFSEEHMATCHGFVDLDPPHIGKNRGLNALMLSAYLSRFEGPVLYEDVPLTDIIDPGCDNTHNPFMYFDQIRFLPERYNSNFDINLIKEVLIENWLVRFSLNWDNKYYNSNDFTYYCDETSEEVQTDHSMVLVGWDDNMIVTGGDSKPSLPGAWIAVNSWGKNWGDEGYCYISYEDTRAFYRSNIFPISYIPFNEDYKLYYYDKLGWCKTVTYETESACGVVKFGAETDDTLTHIGTYITAANSQVEIIIYSSMWESSFGDGFKFENQIGKTEVFDCDLPGYHTFDIEDVLLTEGEDFFVKVKYLSSGNIMNIPVEAAVPEYSDPIIENKKCFTSASGKDYKWDEIGQYGWDLCIKAFCGPTDANTKYGEAIAKTSTEELHLESGTNKADSTYFLITNKGLSDLNYKITKNYPVITKGLAKCNSENEPTTGESNLQDISIVKAETNNNLKFAKIESEDILLLDDGDELCEYFIGNSTSTFGWTNLFELTESGFILEKIRFFMRTEDNPSNIVKVKIADESFNSIFENTILIDTSSKGMWYQYKFEDPIYFESNTKFYIAVELVDTKLDLPAGFDPTGNIINKSFYYFPPSKSLTNLNTVGGCENAAFVIRGIGQLNNNQCDILTVEPSEGVLHSGNQVLVKVRLNGDKREISDFTGSLDITSNGGNINIPINYVVGNKDEELLPSSYTLSQNYPNPFNPATIIEYTVPKRGFVNLSVYDILGREVKQIVNATKNYGTYTVNLNMSDCNSGIYFYRLLINGESITKKMVLLR